MSDHVWLREFADRAARVDCGPLQIPGPDPDRRCDSCGQPLPNQARVWLDEINDGLRSGRVTWEQLYAALGVEGPHLHHILAGMVPLDEETAGRLLAAGALIGEAVEELDVPDPAPKLAEIAGRPRRFARTPGAGAPPGV